MIFVNWIERYLGNLDMHRKYDKILNLRFFLTGVCYYRMRNAHSNIMSKLYFPLAAAVLLPLSSLSAGIIVTTLTDELDTPAASGTGISLREAIRDAASGETITFDSTLSGGTIELTNDGTANFGELVIDKSLSIDASSLESGITIDASTRNAIVRSFNVRCFFISDESALLNNVTFNNLTLRSGRIDDGSGGGAISNQENLTLIACTIKECSASDGAGGGAIFSRRGILALKNCNLFSNFASGRAGDGGAILSVGGGLTLANTTVSQNSSGGQGGGIYRLGSVFEEAPFSITNSTISENAAGTDGGGIYFQQSPLTLSQSTIIWNQSLVGAGIAANFSGSTFSTISTSVIRDNASPDPDSNDVVFLGIRNLYQSLGYNFIGGGNASGVFTIIGDTVDDVTPLLLGRLGKFGSPNLAHFPQADSPLVNAGPASLQPGEPTTDQRGFARLTGSAVDIGSVEYFQAADIQVTNVDNSGSGSLRQAIDLITSPEQFITFAPDLDAGEIFLNSEILIPISATIDASMLPNGIVIDGGSNGDTTIEPGESRCFRIDDEEDRFTEEITFKNLTLRNGIANGEGGAIISRETLTLERCTILDNQSVNLSGSARGGAIHQSTSRPSSNLLNIVETRFSRNSAQGISETTEPNVFSRGGAIFVSASDINCSDSTFTNNMVSGNRASGGAISLLSPAANFAGTTIANNSSEGAESFGGGIYVADPLREDTRRFTNCTISGNTAQKGGGLFNQTGATVLEHCTVVNNVADFGAGLLREPNAGFLSNSIFITSTVVRDNVVGEDGSEFGTFDSTEPIRSGGFNYVGNGTISSRDTDIINADTPILLGNLTDNGGPTQTHLPLADSPLIDAASGSTQPIDQRGLARPAGFADIGSVEFAAPLSLADLWETDFDSDGLTYGIEVYFGTDPESPDTLPLTVVLDENDQPEITFTLGIDRPASSVLVLERSTALTGWVEVFFANQSDAFLGVDTGFVLESSGDTITLTDTSTPRDARAFYRFRADLNE